MRLHRRDVDLELGRRCHHLAEGLDDPLGVEALSSRHCCGCRCCTRLEQTGGSGEAGVHVTRL